MISLAVEEPLPGMPPQNFVLGHSCPCWKCWFDNSSAHLVFWTSCYFCPLSGCPFCHSDGPPVVLQSCIVAYPSIFGTSNAVDDVSNPCMWSDPAVLFLILSVMPSMICTIFLWATASFPWWYYLKPVSHYHVSWLEGHTRWTLSSLSPYLYYCFSRCFPLSQKLPNRVGCSFWSQALSNHHSLQTSQALNLCNDFPFNSYLWFIGMVIKHHFGLS